MDIISAKEAFDQGLTRYFTGKSCKHGHIAQRMVRNGVCVECLKKQRERYRDRHPDKVKAVRDRYRHSDHGKATGAALARRLRAGNPEAEKARQKRFYERQESKRVLEAGRPRPEKCDICKETGKIVFDHCHTQGHFRGWLCDRCNKTLGHVKDDSDLLRKLAAYLENDNE